MLSHVNIHTPINRPRIKELKLFKDEVRKLDESRAKLAEAKTQ